MSAMLRKSLGIFSKGFQASMEWLCLAPILLLAGVIFVPAPSVGWWMSFFLVMTFMGILLKKVFKDTNRIVFIGVAWVVSLVGSFLIVSDVMLILVTSIVGTIFAIRGALYLEKSQEELFPVSLMWLSGAIYFISYFIFTFVERFEGYGTVVTWLGLMFVVMLLLQSNSSHLRTETSIDGKETSLYTPLKWKNRIFILLTVCVILLILNLQLVQAAFQRMVDVVAYFFSILPSPSGSEDGARQLTPSLPFLPEEEAAAGTSIFEMIFLCDRLRNCHVGDYILDFLLSEKHGKIAKISFWCDQEVP